MTNLNVVTFNAASAMPTDRQHLARQILKSASQGGALLLGVECDDLTDDDLDEILDPALWWRVHSSAPTLDGTLIAGRHDRTRLIASRYFVGAPASPVNAPRAIQRARIDVDQRWGLTAAALHLPRRGTKNEGLEARSTMVTNTRGLGADLLAGDLNLRRDAVRQQFPNRTVRSAEVMHVLGAQRLVLGDARPFDLIPRAEGDDHPGLKVTIHPRRGG